jgi:nucleoside-diphosphate-sugar epimerase
MRIFITGASGCIGHYVAETLIKDTNHELFLLVRNPDKLKFDYQYRPNIKILKADLREISQFNDLLKTIDVAILIATCWGGEKESYQINVRANIELLNLLNPDVCQQVIYFSTASILDQNNQPLPQAGKIGTDYISTKYQCFTKLKELDLAPKITTVYPTLVFGGDENKPYSHLSAGLNDLPKWMNLIRWFQADGSFHFIHGRDIAKVIAYLVDNPPQLNSHIPTQLVLGNEPLKVNQAIKQIGNYLGKKIYFSIPLPIWLANIFIKVFKIQMAEWDYFCFNYRHFTYQNAINPATFNLPAYAPTVAELLKVSGVNHT